VAAATPGGIYRMLKDRWKTDLFGHYLCQCLVLDEASQMNLPEAVMAALPLHPAGQLVVVGDPRQMPPIVQHDWANERRRTFKQYQSYQSLFEALLDMPEPPPMVKFTESFRLHRDIAEFLRREIYSKDGIPYFSRKSAVLPAFDHEDPFVTAVLRPEHPIVVIVHDEAASQVRNPFEQRLVEPVLRALASDDLYALSPEHGLGVVVPHRAQRADLLTAIDVLSRKDPLTNDVLASAVDTVERFQGDERTAIMVSATESDRDYLLASSGFLYDPRRLTVAVSRAKQKMVLVASRSVFTLFTPEEEAFANGQIWKNLLRRTCTTLLWDGDREDHHVEVWGNTPNPGTVPS
jgi:superfamily I DNA and/or RNA helicase